MTTGRVKTYFNQLLVILNKHAFENYIFSTKSLFALFMYMN